MLIGHAVWPLVLRREAETKCRIVGAQVVKTEVAVYWLLEDCECKKERKKEKKKKKKTEGEGRWCVIAFGALSHRRIVVSFDCRRRQTTGGGRMLPEARSRPRNVIKAHVRPLLFLLSCLLGTCHVSFRRRSLIGPFVDVDVRCCADGLLLAIKQSS